MNSFINKQINQLQEMDSIYNTLPIDIRTTLDTMALGIAKKEHLDVMQVKNTMVNKINQLNKEEVFYLITNMSDLIQKSTQQDQIINDKTVSKDFISFLIRLYF